MPIFFAYLLQSRGLSPIARNLDPLVVLLLFLFPRLWVLCVGYPLPLNRPLFLLCSLHNFVSFFCAVPKGCELGQVGLPRG